LLADVEALADDPRLDPDPLPITSQSMHDASQEPVPPSQSAVHVSSRHRPLSSALAPAFVHGSPTLWSSQSCGGGVAWASAGRLSASVARRLERARRGRARGLIGVVLCVVALSRCQSA
jgi:hypothetical protein